MNILKVSSVSNPNSVAGAISAFIKDGVKRTAIKLIVKVN